MKIHVIDNTGQIFPLLSSSDAEVAVFSDEIQALNAAEQQPELILLNYCVRGLQTPDYIGLLLSAAANSRIVVIGDTISKDDIVACLLAGAIGYQESQSLQHYIVKMVDAVAHGEAWVSRKMVAYFLVTLRKRQSNVNG